MPTIELQRGYPVHRCQICTHIKTTESEGRILRNDKQTKYLNLPHMLSSDTLHNTSSNIIKSHRMRTRWTFIFFEVYPSPSLHIKWFQINPLYLSAFWTMVCCTSSNTFSTLFLSVAHVMWVYNCFVSRLLSLISLIYCCLIYSAASS